MTSVALNRMRVLWQRELREHPGALLWTPLVLAVSLSAVLGISALLTNELSTAGGEVLEALVEGGQGSSMNISFDLSAADRQEEAGYRVIDESEPVDEDAWNFSREWNFALADDEPRPAAVEESVADKPYPLNALFYVLHNVFLLVMFFVSAWYLLGSLFNDRRDASILFWKSMPVSDWEDVVSRLGIVLLVAPAIYIGLSLATQLLGYAFGWVLLEEGEVRAAFLGEVSLSRAFTEQVAAWALTALWILPLYAWLLLASAGARRSPFMLAVVPIVVLLVLERLLLGSDWLATQLGAHVPRGEDGIGGQGMGFYLASPDWASQAWLQLCMGLVLAAALLVACVWLRRQRFELN
ncbi:MAG: hypothetical protein AAGI11_18610 [Pseudomonadota bacterium]